jgi:diguanylate cyclase (GGDEF)-like protein
MGLNSGEIVDVAVITTDPIEQRLLSHELSQAGFKIRVSGALPHELEAAVEAQPKVVLCDYSASASDAFRFFREIQHSPAGEQFYLVIMSADVANDSVTDALESGANDFLARPLDVREVISRIRVGLRWWSVQQRLRRAAITDGLTGLYNYPHFTRILEAEFSRAQRNAQPLTLIMIDVDHFKTINDTLGHLIGNQVLERFAGLLRNSVRTMDTIGRFGGDEFAVLLPQATVMVAVDVVQRIRKSVPETVRLDHPTHAPLTASFGLADSTDARSPTPAALLELADRALYLAKQRGRNQVVHCGELAPSPDR